MNMHTVRNFAFFIVKIYPAKCESTAIPYTLQRFTGNQIAKIFQQKGENPAYCDYDKTEVSSA